MGMQKAWYFLPEKLLLNITNYKQHDEISFYWVVLWDVYCYTFFENDLIKIVGNLRKGWLTCGIPYIRRVVVQRKRHQELKSVLPIHNNDVIVTTMSSQITSLTAVYSTFYSDVDQRKHQSSASLAFVWGIHRDRWIPRKCFHLMTLSWVPREHQINFIRVLDKDIGVLLFRYTCIVHTEDDQGFQMKTGSPIT